MKDFAAIDFETVNNQRSSVCSVGLVIVRGGEIVDKFYSLIKPEPEYWRTRQTLWSAVQMLTQKLCCQTIHDCPKVVPLHYESE